MPRIVLVNRFFFPDNSATSQLATDLALNLAARGFDVVAVASQQLYGQPLGRPAKNQHRDGVRIRRVSTTRFGRQNLVGRIFDYLSFYVSSCPRCGVRPLAVL